MDMSAIATNVDSGAGAIAPECVPRFPARPYRPHPFFCNPHLATVAAACWPRDCSRLPAATDRLFEVEPGTRLLAKCHWQETPLRHATLVLVHGLEGSSESPYMLGIAERAFQAGFNILRMNQRNCGGTEHLTPTLCHSGLSGDYRAVLDELVKQDELPEIFFSGYSIGGNTITAPEFGYRSAADYYNQASALRVVGQIRVPTMILTAQDDPLVPIDSFRSDAIVGNPFITLVAPEHGGHCAFISNNSGDERFWAEQRVVEFCAQHSELARKDGQ